MACECPVRREGEWRIRIHVPGCTWGAGQTGGEYGTRASHEDTRSAIDEAIANDGKQIEKNQKEGK